MKLNPTKFSGMTAIIALQLLLATAAIAGNQTGALERLKGRELKQAVAGKVVYMQIQGVVLPISYNENKTMSGKLRAITALLAVGTPSRDQGKWWIDKDRLCQRWNLWLAGNTYCYKLSRNGQTVHWERQDGRKGTARLGR